MAQHPLPIALVGLSGGGKSTVARLLAARLGRPLYDLDALVEQAAGRSVAAIFAADGEDRFRALESAALAAALAGAPGVIATGGGVVLRPANRELLSARAVTVWLDAPTEALRARLLADDEPRPLLAGDDVAARLEALRAARTPLYAAVARVRIDTSDLAPDEVARQIIAAIAPGHSDDR